jgi:hypothetical protein
MKIPLLFLASSMLTYTQVARSQVFTLTVQKIMQDQNTWVGSSPSDLWWTENGDFLYFQWNSGSGYRATHAAAHRTG